jgi:gliding motility-associated-like protein
MNPSVDASIKMNCFAVKDGAITISPKGGVVPYTYSWTGNGVNAASKDQTGLTAGDYFVSIKDANNCNLSGIKITISSYPQITFEVDTIHPSCYDDFGKINVKNVKPSDAYKYKIDQENYKDSTIFRNLLSDNQYTITVKNTSNGCESSKKVPIGSVKERVLLSSSSDFTFNDMTCSNKNSSISFLNPKMGYTYSIDYFTTFNTTGKFENLLPGNYKVVVRTKDNCRDTSEIFVVKNVLYSTKPNTTQVKKQYCEGDKASSLVPALNSSYIWYDQQGMLLNTNDKLYDGIYYVGNIEPGKCESDRVEIDVDLSRMSLNLISKKAATCNKQDGEIIIQAVNGIGQIKYTWSNTDGQILGNNAKLVGVSDGTYIVEAEDAIGCKVISSPPISMTCTTPEIPQIVTPDNDGKNDTWKINYKSSYPRVKVQIYNRWGNLVYESQPYEDDWDGKPSVSQTLGKNELPTGTYYYVIDKQGDGTDLESGFVELIK